MKALSRSSQLFVSAAVLLALAAPAAQAGVIIEGTRVVYRASQKEATVRMHNRGTNTVLMQVWADRGNEDSQPQTADAPFLITPPIFRMDPAKSQTARLIFTGETLPQDRESMFWFNTLEVPATPTDKAANYMQIAVRSRIKLIYRPDNLPGTAAAAATGVTWKVATAEGGYVLRGQNPNAYHVALARVALVRDGKPYSAGSGTIPPFGSKDFVLSDFNGTGSAGQVRYGWINDYGAVNEHEAPLP